MKRWFAVAAMIVAAQSALGTCTAPAPFTKAWVGTSPAWSLANNWMPSGVPTTSDAVYICSSAAAQPALSANTTIGSIWVDTGASLNFAGFTLTTSGNADFAGSSGGGTLLMNGTTKTLKGTIQGLSVTGTISLAGATSVNGNFALSGDFTVAGQTIIVAGNFTTSGLGDRLRMTSAADKLTVKGDASFTGGGAAGILTAGELHVEGNFLENNACCTGNAFAPSGSHTTYFDGGKTQTITFNNPSSNNGFQNVAVGSSGTIATSTGAVVIKGNVSDPIGNRWRAANTTFIGATPTIANVQTNATFSVSTTLQNNFTITGDIIVTGTLNIGGRTLAVTGNLTTSGLGDRLTMLNTADRLLVQGNATFNGGGAAGTLTAGELHVGGNFSENNACCTGNAFNPSGTHTTVFDGNKTQTITFNNPSTSNGFQNAEVGGSGTIVNTLAAKPSAYVKGNLTDPVGNRWQVINTLFVGAAPTIANISGGATFPGNTTLQNNFAINGNVSVTGTLKINAHTLTVTGNLTTSGLGDRLTMQNASDRLLVQGNVSFTGGGATGILTAGELHIGGNFLENNACCTGNAFACSGTHTTVFDGGTTQTVTFNNPSSTNAFQNLAVGGSGTIVTGGTSFVRGNFSDPVGFRWRTSSTTFVGATPSIENIKSSVVFSANSALQNDFTIDANLTVSGTLTINGHIVTVTGNLTTSGLGDRLTMTNTADRLLVKGNASFNGGGATGILTAGELHIGGNFLENNACCTGNAFACSGTHTTVFDGGTAQTVTFNNPSSTNAFQNLAVGGSGTVVTGGSSFVRGSFSDPVGFRWRTSSTTFIGATPSIENIKSSVVFSANSTLQTDFTIDANLTVSGTCVINGHTVNVTGNLTTSGLGDRLTLTNANDRLLIKGNANFNGGGAAGIMTAGELHVGGNFTENNACCTGNAFVPSGTHTTVFDGLAAQTITFNNSSTHFQNVRFNSASATMGSALDATGILSSTGGTLLGAGRTLTVKGLDVVGLTFDNVLVVSNTGALIKLDGATFQNYAATATQLKITHPGDITPAQFHNNRFLTTPTTGFYINAQDTASTDANKLTIQMINSTPADGSAFTTTSGGAIVQWLTVATNHNPTPVNDAYIVDEDSQLATTNVNGVLANDTDSDNDALAATLVAGPSSGTLDLRANGSFVYTPVHDFNGTATFTYRADDGKGGSATATVTITIRPINDAPLARDDSYSTSGRLVIPSPGVLFNDSDPDNDSLTAVVVSQPANGTLTMSANGAFTYEPHAGFSGTDTFKYAAKDASLQTTATVTINVSASQQPPTLAFRATASTIKSGSAVTLLWTTMNATTVTLQPNFGDQPLNGSISVSPTATTTYTITATSPAGNASAQLTIEVVSSAVISVVARPHGMLQLPNQTPTDSYVLANLGGSSAQITLTQNGDFFTQSPATFTINAGDLQTITLTALPKSLGIYRGESLIAIAGVQGTQSVPVKMLSLSFPTGRTDASAQSTRVDGSLSTTVAATFTNRGDATAEGLVVSDSPWIIPQSDTITIPPGQSVTTTLTIDHSKRPDGEEPSGALTAGVSLMNLTNNSPSGNIAPNEATTGTVSVSTVAVKDLVPPPVSSGSIAPLAAGEIAYFVQGLAHRTNVVGDLAIVNRSSTSSLNFVKVFATTSGSSPQSAQVASLPSLAPNVSFAMPDLMKGVFGQNSAAGSVMVRGDFSKVSLHAAAAAVGKGFFGGTLAPFRSDRGVAKGEAQILAGVLKDANNHTDLHLQETSGNQATAVIEFLGPLGGVMSSLTESLAPFGYIELIDNVPAFTASVRVRTSDTSNGAIAARALVIDQTTGDVTDVVDWTRVSAFASGETRIVPYVVHNANATTDLIVMNGGATPSSVSLLYSAPAGGGRRRAARSSVSSITLDPGETRVIHDVLANEMNVSGDSSGYLMLNDMSASVTARAMLVAKGTTTALPLLSESSALFTGTGKQFVSLEDASAASVTEARAGTFRTSFGMIEVGGGAAIVRATVHFTYSGTKTTLRAVASKDFTLNAGRPLVVSDMVKSVIGDVRSQYGDLHDVQLDIDVVSGDGAVIPFVMSTDNATGDTLFGWE